MRIFYISLLYFSLLLVTLDTITAKQNISSSINRGTCLTFKRHYFVARLEKTINLLLKLQHIHHLAFSRSLPHTFSDARVTKSIRCIEQTKSLKPLFMVWNDFLSYKSLEDEVFVEDFSKEIFVITKNVLSGLQSSNENEYITPDIDQLSHEADTHKTESILNAIDVTTHALERALINKDQPEHIHTPPAPTRILELKPSVSTDEIAERYYYIQRLKRSINIIKYFDTKISFKKAIPASVSYKSHMSSLMRAMQQTGNVQAVSESWDDMQQYKFIDSFEFIKEFASVIFFSVRHIYYTFYPSNLTNDQQMIIDQAADSFDMEDMLHAIDIIVDQFSHIPTLPAEAHSLTYGEKLQQYWWVAPLTIGSIAIKIAHYYYTQQ